jgi:hypothetical protein
MSTCFQPGARFRRMNQISLVFEGKTDLMTSQNTDFP